MGGDFVFDVGCCVVFVFDFGGGVEGECVVFVVDWRVWDGVECGCCGGVLWDCNYGVVFGGD